MEVKFEYMTPNLLGWGCPHCHTNMIFIEGAITHERRIENNDGVCPESVKKEEVNNK